MIILNVGIHLIKIPLAAWVDEHYAWNGVTFCSVTYKSGNRHSGIDDCRSRHPLPPAGPSDINWGAFDVTILPISDHLSIGDEQYSDPTLRVIIPDLSRGTQYAASPAP